MSGPRERVPGVLFIYHRPTLPWAVVDAGNVSQGIAAFGRHTRYPLWGVNTDVGYRPALDRLDFDAVIVHYSVFVPGSFHPRGYMLDQGYLDLLERSGAYKIALFQDEHHWCGMRFTFLRDFGFDCVYSMLEQPHADEVYKRRTGVSKVVPHLPSYVGAELVRAAGRHAKPDSERRIDVSYRGPGRMPAYMGRGALEKTEIAERFAELAEGSGLALDIAAAEEARIYGRDWHRFTADSRATLGTESGVSCFDLEDEVRLEYERLSAGGSEPSIDEMERGALGRWDWRVPYRTISPRNLEAAAFGVAQILYEGAYSGALEPMRHYIPLRKDFSNFDEVLERYRDEPLRRELTQNARRDLIDSGAYSYETFIASVDGVLADAGVRGERSAAETRQVARSLRRSPRERWRRFHKTRIDRLYVEHPRWWRVVWIAEAPFRIAGRALGGR